MSDFQIPVVKLKIKTHPNADRLEIAEIAGYQCVVQKDQFKTGDYAVYIPEASIVPFPLLEKLGLVDRLAGGQKNRVKAVKIRGVLSQGLVCPLDHLPIEAINKFTTDKDKKIWRVEFDPTDVATHLGITKYEPVVPATLAGNVFNAGLDRTLRYDIENIKKYPEVLQPGEEVVFTEKIHGTWCLAASFPQHMPHPTQGCFHVSSKGHSAKGLALMAPKKGTAQTRFQKITEKWWIARKNLALFLWKNNSYGTYTQDEFELQQKFFSRKIRRCYNPGVNENNVYWKAVNSLKLEFRLNAFRTVHHLSDFAKEPIFVLGEVFGVQDLDYGCTTGSPGFRVFDVYVGCPGKGNYLDDTHLDLWCKEMGLDRVPVLYRGPFSKEKVKEFTDGNETVTGNSSHIREGIVIRPVREKRHYEVGRVQLKSVSEDYLLRKGSTTEFN